MRGVAARTLGLPELAATTVVVIIAASIVGVAGAINWVRRPARRQA